MPVAYRGIKPGNFRDAISIVAIGSYKDGRDRGRKASACKRPSKYQGAEVEKSYPRLPARQVVTQLKSLERLSGPVGCRLPTVDSS